MVRPPFLSEWEGPSPEIKPRKTPHSLQCATDPQPLLFFDNGVIHCISFKGIFFHLDTGKTDS